MKKIKIVNHSDGGHSWYAVKRSLLVELGILKDISSCSYQRGETVYLEEDCDAAIFFNAFSLKMTGQKANDYGYATLRLNFFELRESYKDVSPIRNYARFCYNRADVVSGAQVMLYSKPYVILDANKPVKVQSLTDGRIYHLKANQIDDLIKIDTMQKV